MRKIAVFTGTRAEYHLLRPLLTLIQKSEHLQLQLIVSAMHLSPEYGYTLNRITEDGFIPAANIETLLSSDTAVGTLKSMGLGLLGYADALERLKPDLLLLAGDRTETLAAAQCGLILQIPIFHLHGGEITQGAYDDQIRHAITKMSTYHATSCRSHQQRVIQLGEEPSRVFNVGAIGLDNIRHQPRLARDAVLSFLNFTADAHYLLLTYHPVTAANEPPRASFLAIRQALQYFPQFQIVISYPNSDHGGKAVIAEIELWQQQEPLRVRTFKSLDQYYLDVVNQAAAVVGNSSSGIIEVPSLAVPVVNLGQRQAGRACSAHICHSPVQVDDIRHALSTALATKEILSSADNPYDRGNTGQAILRLLTEVPLSCHKKFFDLTASNIADE